jgi:hypothetical protein
MKIGAVQKEAFGQPLTVIDLPKAQLIFKACSLGLSQK